MRSFTIVDGDDATPPGRRSRRAPPPFRSVEVLGLNRRSPRLVAVSFGGPELEGFGEPRPAASIRVLLPFPGARSPEMPSWGGNEFVLSDASRPLIRTFTPRRFDPESNTLDIEVVVHGEGAASRWVSSVEVGDRVAVSGPGRGYEVDADEAPSYFLAGDETAIPAISQLLEVLPDDSEIEVHMEIADASARVQMPQHRRATVEWHELAEPPSPGESLFRAVTGAHFHTRTRVWAAGEAAAVQRVRRHLFEEVGLERAHASVRGYWKHGKSGDSDPGS